MPDVITKPPTSLKIMNGIVKFLQRRGFALGTMRLLTVPGRKTGKPRTTPVSPLTVDGHRYVIGGFVKGDWVNNARAAGEGLLAKGRRAERVKLVELPAEERRPIMRAFPTEVPHGVFMFLRAGIVADASPDAFEAGAPKVAVFRIDPV